MNVDDKLEAIAAKYGFGTQHLNLRLALREAYEAGRKSVVNEVSLVNHCLCEFAIKNWDGVTHDPRCKLAQTARPRA